MRSILPVALLFTTLIIIAVGCGKDESNENFILKMKNNE